MIEFYELYKDLWYYLELTEELFRQLNKRFTQDGTVVYNEQTANLNPPFKRIAFMEGIKELSGLSEAEVWDEAAVRAHIAKAFPDEPMPPTYGKMLDLLFEEYVEPTFKEPTFVTDFPVAISPLTKRHRNDPRLTERFELFIAGMELANGYSELNDPLDQRARLEDQLKNKEAGDDEAQAVDEDFLRALEQGMAPAAGEGIGIDRLIMLYAGVSSIREVILFPLLRPKT
jgi:lysyl-tRNA synthetase class 2